MSINKIKIIRFFRYLWISVGMIVVLALVFDFMAVKKSLIYDLDFNQSIGPDIVGWYPESRLSQISNLGVDGVDLLAEPVYLKVYSPGDFKSMKISGHISLYDDSEQDIRLGLKQKNGSWDYKQIEQGDFSLTFDLAEVKKNKNQLELILSIPSLQEGARIGIVNNWQILLER